VPGPPWRQVRGVTVGQIVEWFDWTVYGVFAPYFAVQFFPAESAASATLAAFAVFAVSFLARPLGGAVFGRLADRLGRRPAFTASILLMSLGMFMIAFSPTYAQIGRRFPGVVANYLMLSALSDRRIASRGVASPRTSRGRSLSCRATAWRSPTVC
jgi:MFS transporter, MHS family, alpha-ketoglutarate permease